nr:hypothetical protein [Tanacetum cinerariifolium]
MYEGEVVRAEQVAKVSSNAYETKGKSGIMPRKGHTTKIDASVPSAELAMRLLIPSLLLNLILLRIFLICYQWAMVLLTVSVAAFYVDALWAGFQ